MHKMMDTIFNSPSPNLKNSLFNISAKLTEPPLQKKTEEFHDNPQMYRLIQQRDFTICFCFTALILLAVGFCDNPQYEFGIFLVSSILILVHISFHISEKKVWYSGLFLIVLSLFPVFGGPYTLFSVDWRYAIFITCHSFFHHGVAIMIGKKKLHVIVSFSTVCILSFSTLFFDFSRNWTMNRVVCVAAWFLLFPVILNSVFGSGDDVKVSLVKKLR